MQESALNLVLSLCHYAEEIDLEGIFPIKKVDNGVCHVTNDPWEGQFFLLGSKFFLLPNTITIPYSSCTINFVYVINL